MKDKNNLGYGFRCRGCGHEWKIIGDNYSSTCDRCGDEYATMVSTLECVYCGYNFKGEQPSDCPECWEYASAYALDNWILNLDFNNPILSSPHEHMYEETWFYDKRYTDDNNYVFEPLIGSGDYVGWYECDSILYWYEGPRQKACELFAEMFKDDDANIYLQGYLLDKETKTLSGNGYPFIK